jgi:mannan endo-1,4-beta-mannosidase
MPALLPLDKELHSDSLAFCPGLPPASGVDHNAFFSKPATKALFQQYVSAIITRTNTITGRANRDDPTIM